MVDDDRSARLVLDLALPEPPLERVAGRRGEPHVLAVGGRVAARPRGGCPLARVAEDGDFAGLFPPYQGCDQLAAPPQRLFDVPLLVDAFSEGESLGLIHQAAVGAVGVVAFDVGLEVGFGLFEQTKVLGNVLRSLARRHVDRLRPCDESFGGILRVGRDAKPEFLDLGDHAVERLRHWGKGRRALVEERIVGENVHLRLALPVQTVGNRHLLDGQDRDHGGVEDGNLEEVIGGDVADRGCPCPVVYLSRDTDVDEGLRAFHGAEFPNDVPDVPVAVAVRDPIHSRQLVRADVLAELRETIFEALGLAHGAVVEAACVETHRVDVVLPERC